MAVKWETIKAGDTLYDVRRQKMGNTMVSRMACWPVYIESIDHEAGKAVIRWNHNAPQIAFRSRVEKYRRKPYQENKRG